VAAPEGTAVTIWVAVADTMAAAVRSNATAVAADRFRPVTVTVVAAAPEAGGEAGDFRGHGGGDPPDRVVALVGEPQRPIRPGRDPRRFVDARVDRHPADPRRSGGRGGTGAASR
jgi:hypothetical protein